MTMLRPLLLATLTLLAAACSKSSDSDAPLAFVPADTPFVIANAEPTPDAVADMWSQQMKTIWPTVINLYDGMLAKIPDDGSPETASTKRVVQAILTELKGRDSVEKWAEAGFTTKARSALYGVGMVPVLRVELGDPDKFRAMVARIEKDAGASLGTSKVGDQEVRTFAIAATQGLIAIEDKQLVVSILPTNASEDLRRRVLGLDRPEKNLATEGSLESFNKTEGYLPMGSGWIDFRRIVALIDVDPGYNAFAQLISADHAPLDALCRSEMDAIAARAPRVTMGYTRFEGRNMDFRSRLDLDSAFAQSFIKLSSPPPGSAATSNVLYDIALSLPVLKIKDFLVERTNAIVDAPFKCPTLAPMNESAAQLKQQLSQFIPPPFSDMTGLRLMLDRVDIPTDGNPDVSAAVLIGSSNPMAMIGMAQMAVPALSDFKLALDGKPVDLPPGIIPTQTGYAPVMRIAANESAVALGIGDTIDLAGFLGASAASDGQLLHASYSGKFYDVLGALLTRFSAVLPAPQSADMEQQKALYAIYARWIRKVDIRVNATPKGIEMLQKIELNSN